MQNSTTLLIGCGAIAREHLKTLKNIPGVTVAAVCDLSPARAESTADRFQVRRWGVDYLKFLDEVQPSVVHITTSPSSHFAIASECLKRGINVLCEKPIVSNYAEFAELSAMAHANNCLLLENQNLRCHSSVIKIKKLIDSGKFGHVVDVEIFFSLPLVSPGSPYIDTNVPHFGANLPGGVIGDFLPHIAYLSLLFAGQVSSIRTLWRKGENSTFLADEFRAILKGESSSAYVGFSATSSVSGYWIRVIGTEMHAEANLLEPPRISFRRSRKGEPAVMSMVDGIAESRDHFIGAVKGLCRKLAGSSSYDGLDAFIRQVYGALSGANDLPVSLAEMESSVKLVEQLTSEGLRL